MDALGRWVLRRLGRFAGLLYVALIVGSLGLYAVGIYVTL